MQKLEAVRDGLSSARALLSSALVHDAHCEEWQATEDYARLMDRLEAMEHLVGNMILSSELTPDQTADWMLWTWPFNNPSGEDDS